MDLSFSSMFFHDASLDQIFRAPGSTGADSLEFWLETPDFWLHGLPIGNLKECMGRYPARSPVSVHAPVLDLNPCSINPDVREVSIRWIGRSVRLAGDIGAGVCTIHPGRRTAKRPPTITDYTRLAHMLDCIEPVAGSVPVKVAIENMEPAVNALLTTPAEVMSVLEERTWLWFTLDIAHASVSGIETIAEFLDTAGKRIANIHLSGCLDRVMHHPVTRDPHIGEYLSLIQDSGFSGPLTLEINDLVLPGPMDYEEKIEFMSQEITQVRSYFT